jgi:hypothetical protein
MLAASATCFGHPVRPGFCNLMTGFHRIAASVAVSAATGDGSLAAHLPGVAIDPCDADESSDTAAVEVGRASGRSAQSVRGDMANTPN